MLPLSGVRVADFTRHLPGPYATDLLAKLGAEVFKLEPPDGDPTRWIPPLSDDHSALYALLNSGKRSVVVDLKEKRGRDFARRLAGVCDVAVESYRPGVATQFGIDAASLQAINPRLIYCSISGFGSQSERSGHDLNFVALAGLLDLQKSTAGEPVIPAAQIGDTAGALYAALMIVSALRERDRTGAGRILDISLLDCARAVMTTAEAAATPEGAPMRALVTGGMPCYETYETADGGFIAVGALEPRFWEAFCNAIGRPDLIERHLDRPAWPSTRAEVAGVIRTRSRAEWERVFAPIDACTEPVLTMDEARERFGALPVANPIARNFAPPAAVNVDPLGASFAAAAQAAGFDGKTVDRMRSDAAFQPAGKLKRFLFRAHQRLLGTR
jgi:alpha-methylacyl-CoA racemase